MPESYTSAGWYVDPFGQGDGRYWNGSVWTDAVSRGGVTVKLPPDPDQAEIPPVPGSELQSPTPTPMPLAQPATAPPPAPPKKSPAGIIIALLVAIVVAVVIFLVMNQDDSDDSPTTSIAPPVTEAPVTPTAPPVTQPPVTTPPDTTPPDTTASPTTP